VSDQWGQPQEPQNPYGQQPPSPYGQQPPNPYGQQPPPSPYGQPADPYGQSQNPYGQQPTNPYGQPGQQSPSPYGQQSGPNPYGQQPPNPYGQPTDPYGQPQGQFPGQPGYGYPGAQPQKSKKGLIFGAVGAVIVVLIIIVVFVSKGSTSGGTATQAQTCTNFQAEETANNNEDPTTEPQIIQQGQSQAAQVATLANNAQAGPVKTELQKYDTDMNSLVSYLQANPSINLEDPGDNPPPQLIADATALEGDVTSISATCGIPNPDASDFD
jgi:hypothetical protein